MLRLCYDLNRYSVDLDFFVVKEMDENSYFEKLRKLLGNSYDLTDSQMKHNTILFELRGENYPRKLKIEIRRVKCDYEYQQRIAFSKYGTSQVLLNVLTLQQAMRNKVAAALDRKIIRDFFDLEFIVRCGEKLMLTNEEKTQLGAVLNSFTKRDYKVVLGSILEKDQRDYHIENGFPLLRSKLTEIVPWRSK